MSELLQASVTFTRTCRPANYESVSISAQVPFLIDPSSDMPVLEEDYRGAFNLAKLVVLKQTEIYGLGHEYVEESDEIREVVLVKPAEMATAIMHTFPGTQVEGPEGAPTVATLPEWPPGIPTPPHPHAETADQSRENADWFKAQEASVKTAISSFLKALAKSPQSSATMWDNRADKKHPKAPDFKHKATGLGVWL